MDKEGRACNTINIVVSINCYLLSFSYGSSYAGHCFVDIGQLVRRVHVFEARVEEILGLRLGSNITSGEDSGHQWGNGQRLFQFMCETMVGRPKVPTETNSLDGVDGNFGVHAVHIGKGT